LLKISVMKIIKKSLIALLILILLSTVAWSQKKSSKTGKTTHSETTYEDPYKGKADNELNVTELYIKKYRDLAISEMKRSRVPASITLAQGILESGNGNSYLAQKANNHFGIKCGKDWKGESIYFDDDQANECFRKYQNAEESFKDHSDYLSKNVRYESLFKLELYDYKGWATGLKEAGYATRRNYAELLIDLVEKNQLNIYDMLVPSAKTEPALVADQHFKYNGIVAMQVKDGDTYSLIAKRNGIGLQKLLEYNDLTEQRPLKEGDIVYLGPKKTTAKESYHIVKKEDRMYTISQEYGIKLASLYEKNLLKSGEEPAIGEILYLRQKRTEPAETRTIAPEQKTETPPVASNDVKTDDNIKEVKKESVEPTKTEFEEVPVVENNQVNEVVTPESKTKVIFEDEEKQPQTENDIKEEKKTVIEEFEKNNEPANAVNMHKVQPGETLFSISKKYGISVEELKKLNNLVSNELSVGDNLIVGHVETSFQEQASNEQQTDDVKDEADYNHDTTFHIVQEGEDLFIISRKYNTTIIKLLTINRLPSQKVFTGQKIIIALPDIPVQPKVSTPETPASKSSIYDDPDKLIIKKTNVTTPTPTKTAEQKNNNSVETNQPKYHVVQVKETLFSLSKLYNVSIANLKEWNKLTSDALSVGQKLIVGYESNTDNIVQPNVNAPDLPTQNEVFHTVKSGETLFSISKMYGITVDEIRKLNNLVDNNIKLGQKLRIK